MSIRRVPDAPNQAGHWFVLMLEQAAARDVLRWCHDNLGKRTKMKGALATGWVPLQPDGQWSVLSPPGSPQFLVLWNKHAATLFMTFHPIEQW